MGDTGAISPEERAGLRTCVCLSQQPAQEIVLRLLDALDAAEARAGQAEDGLTAACLYGRKEAEAARLRAERDWLAEKLADIADQMNRPGAPTFCAVCNTCPVGDEEMEGRTCLVAIAEAARRAVADAERRVKE